MGWFGFKKKIESSHDYDITFFSIFSDLRPDELKLVENKVRLIELKKGEFVFKEGEEPTSFYLILSGRLRILRSGQLITHLHPGDYFGESSLLTGKLHSATVDAQNDSIVLKIEKNDFLNLVKEIPSLSLHISRTLGHRLANTNREPSTGGESKVISVIYERSQIGATTFLLELAKAVVRETGSRTIFLDLSDCSEHSKGAETASSVLKSYPLHEFSVMKVADVEESINKQLSPVHTLKLSNGEARHETAKQVAHLISYCLNKYQYVFMDLSVDTNPITARAIQQSDLVYYIIDEDERDAKKTQARIQELISSFGFSEDQIRLIVKEKKGENFISFNDLQSRSVPVFAILPEAAELAANRHIVELINYQIDRGGAYAKKIRFLARELCGRTVGLALGSGAAFGYAHVGVLKVLEENGIEVDIISASSIGAVIGAMWAVGLPSARLIEILKTLDRKTTFFRLFGFGDLSVAHRGFFKGEQVLRFLKSYVGDVSFRDLQIPIKIVATDLATGFPVLFSDGSLLEAIRASISIPGIFRPYQWRGRFLIDGGVADPLPIRVLSKFGAKKIIAVNVLQSPDDHANRLEIVQKKRQKMAEISQTKNIFVRFVKEHEKDFLNRQSANIFNVLMKTIQFMEYGMATSAARQADIILNPVVTDAHWAEFFSHEKFIKRGEEEANRYLSEIKKLVKE